MATLKYATLVFCLIGLVIAKNIESKLNDPRVVAGIAGCSEKKGIQVQTLFDSLKTDEENDKIKDYNFCIMEAIGVIGTDGKLDLNVVKEYLNQVSPNNEEDILNTCYNKTGVSIDVAYSISKCLSRLHFFD